MGSTRTSTRTVSPGWKYGHQGEHHPLLSHNLCAGLVSVKPGSFTQAPPSTHAHRKSPMRPCARVEPHGEATNAWHTAAPRRRQPRVDGTARAPMWAAATRGDPPVHTHPRHARTWGWGTRARRGRGAGGDGDWARGAAGMHTEMRVRWPSADAQSTRRRRTAPYPPQYRTCSFTDIALGRPARKGDKCVGRTGPAGQNGEHVSALCSARTLTHH